MSPRTKLIPCAAHKPPHQKGRRQSAGNCKSVGTAAIKACGPHGPVQEALGQILLAADRPRPSRFHKKHYVMKCEAQRKACQNMSPKPSKTQPGMPPNPPKSTPRASRGAKMDPKGASDQANVPPLRGSAQEQQTVAGGIIILFRSFFSNIFLYFPNPPKPLPKPFPNQPQT